MCDLGAAERNFAHDRGRFRADREGLRTFTQVIKSTTKVAMIGASIRPTAERNVMNMNKKPSVELEWHPLHRSGSATRPAGADPWRLTQRR